MIRAPFIAWRFVAILLFSFTKLHINVLAQGLEGDGVAAGLMATIQGDLETALDHFRRSSSADALHSIGNILLIQGDVAGAVKHHWLAKDVDKKSIPPLASVCNDADCGTLADVLWSSSVIKQQLSVSSQSDEITPEQLFSSHIDLAQQLEAAGLMKEAAKHLELAGVIKPDDIPLQLHRMLTVPAVYESSQHVHSTRTALLESVGLFSHESLQSNVTLPSLDRCTLQNLNRPYHDTNTFESAAT
jgi:hypothetical protein